MHNMKRFEYNDGGRSRYFKGKVGDCVVRAGAIASGRDYKDVYNLAREISGESPRNGMDKKPCYELMKALGGVWHPTMKIGSGCKVHLKAEELPKGRIVCNCSGHLVAVIDGVINDIIQDDRNGTRCVYGYWVFK